jgi:hypothetical protein
MWALYIGVTGQVVVLFQLLRDAADDGVSASLDITEERLK